MPRRVDRIIRMINRRCLRIVIGAKTDGVTRRMSRRDMTMSDDDWRGAKIITFRNGRKARKKSVRSRESDRNPSGIINAFLIAARCPSRGFLLKKNIL